MRTSRILIAAGAASLAACGQSGDDSAGNAAANVAAAPNPEKAPYCFFKDAETKGWKASVGKDGNVVVSGKAYRSDSRYIAEIGKIDVAGTTATVRPTVNPNTTGFGATDNWWDVTKTIPGSSAVKTVLVKCGDKTVATLAVPRKG
jgi:putative lipoprotein